MALKETDKENFETLERAHKNGDLCVVECEDIKTGEYVAVICAIQEANDDNVNMIPLARMFSGDPTKEVKPPAGATEVEAANDGDEG